MHEAAGYQSVPLIQGCYVWLEVSTEGQTQICGIDLGNDAHDV